MVDLEDMAGQHFLPRRRACCQDRKTWLMRRQGRLVRSRTDYILGSDCRIFQNVALRDPMHNSDYFMVMGSLREASPREHSNYLGIRTLLPLRLTGLQTRTQADELFVELRRAILKPVQRFACHNSWISAETWIFVDERVSMRRKPGRDQRRLRQLGRAIWDSLKEDRRQRMTTAVEAVESLLTRTHPFYAKLGGGCGGGTDKQ